jgi:hypothetical protein
MDLHQRQQFDFLLQTATERFVARLEERFRGAEPALARLRGSPDGEGVWLGAFVDAIFQDFLLDDVDGGCFVLRSLPKRSVDWQTAALASAGTVEQGVGALARGLFAELLLQKAVEALEQHSGYQPV